MAATTLLRASVPLLNQEVGVAIMKVRFEGVIPMVGGLGRRQDSRGGTAKPSGALSQAESHLTLPGSTKHLTRGVGGGGGGGGDRWLWPMTGGFKGWDRWRPLARRYGGGGWGCPGMEVRGQQDSEKTAPGLGCGSYLLQLFPGTSWSNAVIIFIASSFHWVLHTLPVPLLKPPGLRGGHLLAAPELALCLS